MAAAGSVPYMTTKDIKKQIIKQIKSFIKLNCDQKTEGLIHYLCEFKKTYGTANAYLVNGEFFKSSTLLAEAEDGAVYESEWTSKSDTDNSLWTIQSGSEKVKDIIVKTRKLDVKNRDDEPLFEAYINFVLINNIIVLNPGIGLVPTFGLFYCGIKGDIFCVDKDGNKIDENNSIFIVQEQKNAKPLSVVKKFTKEMLIQLFDILVKLEENGIYHCDINYGNVLVDETNNDKIYLIDFGLASFMINGKQVHQRPGWPVIGHFFSICDFLLRYNKPLHKIIYSLSKTLQQIFDTLTIKIIYDYVKECLTTAKKASADRP